MTADESSSDLIIFPGDSLTKWGWYLKYLLVLSLVLIIKIEKH